MRTKLLLTTLKVLPLTFTLAAQLHAQTPAERLEQGVQFQSDGSDLNAAIAEFKAVLKESARSQRFAAEARYRLAECFSSLGNHERMEAQLKALRADFPADNKWVIKGNNLAPAESHFHGTPWKDGEFSRYEVKLLSGKVVGEYMFTTRKLPDSEEGTWETIAVRTAGGNSLSRSEFTAAGYRPKKSRWYIDIMGDVTQTFDGKGGVTFLNSETKEEKDRYDHAAGGKSDVPFFDNEQVVQVIRTLDQEIGTKQKTLILSAHQGAVPIPFDMEVTAHEDIQVVAGTFPCAKVETSLRQTFYISRDADRRIVRIDLGAAKAELQAFENWDSKQWSTLSSKELGTTVSLPGMMVYHQIQAKPDFFRAILWSGDFAGRQGLIEINQKTNLVEAAKASSEAYAKVLHEGYAKNYQKFEILDAEWKEVAVGNTTGVGMRVKRSVGEIIEHEYQVHCLHNNLALSFRINYAAPDEGRAIMRAEEILKTFQWSH